MLQSIYTIQQTREEKKLQGEISRYGDILLVPMTDVYRSLARKLKLAYAWAFQNTDAEWFLKIDDDSYVRIQDFESVSLKWPITDHPTAYAASFGGGGVLRWGKWAEMKYKKKKYPPFPQGAGHATNRALVSWIVKNFEGLVEYQGEDTSLGIWLDEAPFTAKLLKHPTFTGHSGDCFDKKKTVVGHDISISKLKNCFEKTEDHSDVTANELIIKCEHPDKNNAKKWELFVEVITILESIGAQWSLFAGTMLHFTRECKLGPSDIDFLLDFEWWKKNENNFNRAFRHKGYVQYYKGFKAFGSFTEDNAWSYGYPMRKVNGPQIKIDFHSTYRLESPDKLHAFALYDPRTKAHRCLAPISTLKRTTWGQIPIYIPYPARPYLEAMYGLNWKIPYKNWNWAKEPFTIGSCVRTTILPLPKLVPQKPIETKVLWCGYDNTKLVESLWPRRSVQKINRNSVSHEHTSDANSILVVGMEGPGCPANIEQFKGKILYINGESKISKINSDRYYIGAVENNKKNALTVFYAAISIWRISQLENIEVMKMLTQKKSNGAENKHFMLYMSSRCIRHRELAFDQITKMVMERGGQAPMSGGKCHGTVKKTAKNTYKPKYKKWTSTYLDYRNFKFALTMENTVQSEYITEKIVNAFLGGAVPIYYGSSRIFDLFNREAFVFYDPNKPKIALDQIEYLNSNAQAYATMTQKPIFAENAIENYFSLDDSVGNGKLKQKIKMMMGDI